MLYDRAIVILGVTTTDRDRSRCELVAAVTRKRSIVLREQELIDSRRDTRRTRLHDIGREDGRVGLAGIADGNAGRETVGRQLCIDSKHPFQFIGTVLLGRDGRCDRTQLAVGSHRSRQAIVDDSRATIEAGIGNERSSHCNLTRTITWYSIHFIIQVDKDSVCTILSPHRRTFNKIFRFSSAITIEIHRLDTLPEVGR